MIPLNKPLVVVTDSMTASSSELVVSCCLRVCAWV